MGRDLTDGWKIELELGFNPRARVGRDQQYGNLLYYYYSFNPRARVGRDLLDLLQRLMYGVVSIHAPAWGATPIVTLDIPARERFNPRARVGRDLFGDKKERIVV